MRNIIVLFLLTGALCLFWPSNIAFAGKKNNSSTQNLQVLSNDGEVIVYGSVLSPKADEINFLPSKPLLAKVRKAGLSNLIISITSKYDSTKTYSVPGDAVSIQRKVIKKKAGKYLVISIFNLTSQSGITISPSALPTDDYKLRITGKGVDVTTDTFNYRTPALIVGTVDSMTTGLVSVEDLLGEKISDRTVATNPNGTFFTEVRASKIEQAAQARKYLKAQTTADSDTTGGTTFDIGSGEEETTDEIESCVVHAETDTDLYAIAPLVNDPNSNSAITNEPLTVDDQSTLAATLAIESAQEGNDDLANELAQSEFEDLQQLEEGEGEEEFTGEPFDPGCNIDQFASNCSDDEAALAQIGKDFKEFVSSNPPCYFPEFNLIKKIIPKLPEEANVFIGKGYCEHATREEDENRPCQIYAMILAEFKTGRAGEALICPPYQCKEFENIRPPKCFEPQGFCEEPMPLGPPGPRFDVCRGPRCMPPPPQQTCFNKPMKDLYCSRIDVDIKREECKDEGFGPKEFRPNWIVVKNLKGNEYCVPSNIPKPPPPPGIIDFQGPPSTPEGIAEECELNSCHKSCESKFGNFPKPMPMPEPFFSPASGSITAPLPPAPMPTISSAAPTTGAADGVRGGVRGQIFGGFGQPQPAPPKCEVCDCHFACDAEAGKVADCGNPDSKYFSIKCCKGPGPYPMYLSADQFSPPYGASYGGGFGSPPPFGKPGRPGKGPIGQDKYGCLCGDPNNFNEKGFIKEDTQKTCENKCPEGYEINPNARGNCLPICSEGQVRDPGGICRKNCPPGQNENEFGECTCPPGQVPDGKDPRKCVPSGSTCPDYCYNQPLFRKLLASHDFGSTGYTPPTTGPGYVPPGSFVGGGNTLPPECQRCLGGGGPANCPQGQKYDPATRQCIPTLPTTCPGNMYPNPNYRPGDAQCICPPGLPYWDGNAGQCVAVCPGGNPSASANVNMPPGSPIPCTGGGQNQCGSNMLPNNVPGEAQCICPPALPYWDGSTNSCVAICPNGNPPSSASANLPPKSPIPCSSGGTTLNYCSPGISVGTNSCTCNPSAGAFNSNGLCTCPTNSGPYTKETGCTSTQRPCTAGEGPSNGCYCFSGGFVGPDGKCQCPNGNNPPYTGGGCSTSQNYCVAGTGPSTTNPPCVCAPPATPTGPNANCQCPPGSSIAYSQQGCGTSTTNYCSPGILVGTNGCTCNPSGGAFNSNSYCACPTNSGPYTKETGCTSTTTQCPSPFVPNPSGTPPCKCPDTIPYTSGSTCVVTCPTNLIPATEANGQKVCKCSNGAYPDPQGSCGGHTCALNEVPTAANPCTCAGSATFNAQNICSCSGGQTYSATGCIASTTCTAPKVLDPATNACVCPTGQAPDPANPNNCIQQVTCAAPKILNSATNTCVCPTGQVQDPANPNNCIQQVTCTAPKVLDPATNACMCPAGQVPDPANPNNCIQQVTCTAPKVLNSATNTCVCPTGQVQDPANANNCIPQ